MYSVWVFPAIAGFLTLWLGILSFLVWQEKGFLRSLFPKSGERDIRRKFEEVLQTIDSFGKELKSTKGDLSDLRKEGSLHISRFWLLRYNPYEDSGGDQSFTVALLDKNGSGIVLTSLHARSGTRVFAKPIDQGKSSKYKLSNEEEEVIKKALER